ncbi:hypothetical protein F4776DRAFT_660848 [Hypoxylon sp. NC0597]|nr:hypothetical protein F4776DRAFT_660848 [Hypoxylon sp. NC0597]
MDDTTNLVSDLLQKLAELDNKVNEYRQDMAQEFRRYSQQRLRNLPRDVSAKVEKMVAAQFHKFPALRPSLDNGADSQSESAANDAAPVEKAWPVRLSSPPASPRSPNIDSEEGPRSPHEREREFHGLFTPSYLPLLDAVQRRSPTPPALPAQVPEVEEPNHDQDISSGTLVNAAPSRPDPVRRHTADTESSITSDDSTTRLRRSALRRSSSSSTKTQSPRRVRFEVEGEEVLPTSSPPISPRASDLPTSPLGNPTSLLDESYNTIIMNEGTDLLGSSPPMPKKITSTDRLKAMARNSTEDTSKWEVVGNLDATDDDDEDELVMAGLHGRKSNDITRVAPNHVNSESTAHRINDARVPTQLGAPLTAVREVDESETAEEADDIDDVLMMPPLSSFKDKKRFSPPLEAAPEIEPKVHESQKPAKEHHHSTGPSNPDSEPDLTEEDMFEFEDSEANLSNNKDDNDRTAKYIDEEEEEEEDDADATPIAENPVLYSTSPAIPVRKSAPSTPPSPPRHMAASVGSYRGKPFSIDVVRDPELHKKAAEMGDFYTFVGSVDGRSGVDEISSYRPELTYFTGTPRSLSERLMKEDLEEARRNTDGGDRD